MYQQVTCLVCGCAWNLYSDYFKYREYKGEHTSGTDDEVFQFICPGCGSNIFLSVEN